MPTIEVRIESMLRISPTPIVKFLPPFSSGSQALLLILSVFFTDSMEHTSRNAAGPIIKFELEPTPRPVRDETIDHITGNALHAVSHHSFGYMESGKPYHPSHDGSKQPIEIYCSEITSDGITKDLENRTWLHFSHNKAHPGTLYGPIRHLLRSHKAAEDWRTKVWKAMRSDSTFKKTCDLCHEVIFTEELLFEHHLDHVRIRILSEDMLTELHNGRITLWSQRAGSCTGNSIHVLCPYANCNWDHRVESRAKIRESFRSHMKQTHGPAHCEDCNIALVEQHYHFSVVTEKLMSMPVTTPDGIVAPPQRVHHSSAESLPAFGEDTFMRNFILCELEGLIRSDDALPMFFICPHLKRVSCWNFYEGDHRDYSLRLFQAAKMAERDKGCRIQYFYGKSDQPMKSLATVPSWHMNSTSKRRLGEIMNHDLSYGGTLCHGTEHPWTICPNIYALDAGTPSLYHQRCHYIIDAYSNCMIRWNSTKDLNFWSDQPLKKDSAAALRCPFANCSVTYTSALTMDKIFGKLKAHLKAAHPALHCPEHRKSQ